MDIMKMYSVNPRMLNSVNRYWREKYSWEKGGAKAPPFSHHSNVNKSSTVTFKYLASSRAVSREGLYSPRSILLILF